jgi:GH35 family endo-1,4-beta-xylanase
MQFCVLVASLPNVWLQRLQVQQAVAMSDTRFHAGRLIKILLVACVIAFLAPASAKDDDDNEDWKNWKDFHKDVREHSRGVNEGSSEYLNFWRDYVHNEFVDGIGWQFRDATHSARHSVSTTHKYEGSEWARWAQLYNRHHFEVTKQPHQASDVEFTHTADRDIDSERKLSLYFCGFSPTSDTIRAVYHQTKAPHKKNKWDQTFQLSPKPQFFEAIFTVPPAKAGEYSLTLELGDKPGKIELTYLSLRDISHGAERTTLVKNMIKENVLERSHEKKSEPSEVSPEEVENRIKDFRLGDLTIIVRDKTGKPVPAAMVEVVQLRHYFLFGCNLDNLHLDDHSAFQRNYQQRFAELFNYAKLPCFWSTIEPQPGKRDFSKIEATEKWCRDHDITTNGYGLVSPFHCPNWAPKDFRLGVGQLRATVIECIRRLGDRIHSWDVVDEVVYAKGFPKTNVLSQWLAQDKEVGVIERALLWAQYASGERKQTFIVNEINGSFFSILQQRNSLPDGIGLVCGMQNRLIPPRALWKCCKETTTFGKELHLTELAILSGECRPNADYLKTVDWPSTKDGEAAQADYIVKIYSILFSSPKVVSISWRDLSDQGAWMGAPGGLLRRDGTPKPAYYRLMDLIHKQWWTNAPPKPTDGHGASSTRAYFGDYNVTVRDGRGHAVKTHISFTPATQREANIVTIGN